MWQKFIIMPFKVCLVVSAYFAITANNAYAEQVVPQTTEQKITLRFAVPHFPPYIYLNENKKLAGQGIVRVTQVLNNLEVNYEFELVANYGVALREMRSGNVDGFFLATQNRFRDRIAKISDAVLINNWSWFYKTSNVIDVKHSGFREQAKIGTILNTNTQVWLQDNNYPIATLSNDVDTLVEMLLADRLDAVFLSESVFVHALSKRSQSLDNIASIIEASRDFSVYFSNNFLVEHRWFLDAFNSELAKLKAQEKEAL
ncbi:transporter substrate-binding domain-containing protein [Pseudoalteromonas spongiae]|uniref:Transporter substrate-binding domain-containing protein n=1 Tax=Pseudoalteromonas spongiae TaxID=298657 RepID=A0ABU8EUA6_9GAMM